jgi:hypothetical protein
MSFDNPSREANPWATLKRTDKTKSLRFVRFCQPVSAQQPNSPQARASILATHPYWLSAVVADSRLEMQMKRMSGVVLSISLSTVVAATRRAQRGELSINLF